MITAPPGGWKNDKVYLGYLLGPFLFLNVALKASRIWNRLKLCLFSWNENFVVCERECALSYWFIVLHPDHFNIPFQIWEDSTYMNVFSREGIMNQWKYQPMLMRIRKGIPRCEVYMPLKVLPMVFPNYVLNVTFHNGMPYRKLKWKIEHCNIWGGCRQAKVCILFTWEITLKVLNFNCTYSYFHLK